MRPFLRMLALILCISWASPSWAYIHPELIELLQSAKGEKLDLCLGMIQARKKTGEITETDMDRLGQLALSRAEEDAEARPVLLTFLGQLGKASFIPSIIPFLRDQSHTVRLYTAQALGAIGDPAALPAVEGAIVAVGDRSDPEIAQEFWMLTYTKGTLSLRQNLRNESPTQKTARLRNVLVLESHWLVRVDALAILATIDHPDVWDGFFDALSAWPGPPVYIDHLTTQCSNRYKLNREGFVEAMRVRGENEQLFGLSILRDVGTLDEMGPLNEIAHTAASAALKNAAKTALQHVVGRN